MAGALKVQQVFGRLAGYADARRKSPQIAQTGSGWSA
jgi:hypothetical protein